MSKIEVVAAIIIHDDKILCMQRGASKYAYLEGKYEFPGGKIESGEAREKALMRELREELELSLDIREEDFYMTIHHVYPDFEITLHCFICRVDQKNFVRNEHTDHKWLPAKDLLTLDWAMADMPVVEKLMDGGF
ncbi:MAG: (deoxy)nucleoside triphosphate pyrophosphohydrolase [Saccharofermentanales bacterium]